MKNLVVYFILFCSTTWLCCIHSQEKVIFELDVGMWNDERLPTMNKDDLGEMIEAANQMLIQKLNSPIQFKLRNVVEESLEDAFKRISIKNRDMMYKEWLVRRYTPEMSEQEFWGMANKYRNETQRFLLHWPVTSMQQFLPELNIMKHKNAWKPIQEKWLEKREWLKTLKTPSGEKLLHVPGVPWQSGQEWSMLLFEQGEFDLIVTNGLIIVDGITTPWLHSIFKHSKIGGSGYQSPKRKDFGGQSIMIDTIELFGAVEGLSVDKEKVSQSTKNKAMGAYFLAHEFGHTYYKIPDQYEHGADCLMNTAYEDLEVLVGYKKLIANNSACEKCKPWIDTKHDLEGWVNVLKSPDHYLDAAQELLYAILDCPESTIDMENYLYPYLEFGFRYFADKRDALGMQDCFKVAEHKKIKSFRERARDMLGWTEKELDDFLKKDLENQ